MRVTEIRSRRLTRRRNSLVAVPLVIAALGACSDRGQPLSAAPAVPRGSTAAQPSTWRGHWNSPLELWVYDKTPEVGVNAHLNRGELYDTHLRMINATGMRIVRHTVYWQLADRDGDGVYDPDFLFDTARKVELAKRHGLQVLAVVHGMDGDTLPRPWHRATSQEDFDNRLTRFVADMTARYPDIKLWQIWNEQDAGSWGEPWQKFNGYDWRQLGRAYVRTLQKVHPVVRADPSRWLILGGLTGQNLPFVEGMYARFKEVGQPYPFDILALHGYGPTPYDGDGPFRKVHWLTPIMAAANDVNRPIWITEAGTGGGDYVLQWGWPSGDAGAVFDQLHTAYWQTLVNDLYDTPASKVIGYNLYTPDANRPPADLPDGRPAKDYASTLLRGADMVTPRPAYAWLSHPTISGTLRARWDRSPAPGTFRIRTSGQVPVSHPYHYEGSDIVIEGVVVNTLTPTVIRFKWPTTAEAPEPCSRSCPIQY